LVVGEHIPNELLKIGQTNFQWVFEFFDNAAKFRLSS